MPLIHVELHTSDTQMQELCHLYWQNDEEGKFIHNVADFAERFGLKQNEVAKIVSQYCRVYRDDEKCSKCGIPIRYLKNRSDISINWRRRDSYCKKCMEEIIRQQEELRQQQTKSLRQEKVIKMNEAFEGGVYESLSPLEFNFLVALATSSDADVARKKNGLAKDDASSIINKLNDLHLINWNIGIQGYSILNELKMALNKIGLQRRVKSIFGSPKAQEVYRKLKNKYLFVYPEIPICAFIDREQVDHLFCEEWHSSYFLMARIDFVICESDGKPKFAIEYQGGYHQSQQQKEKDEFKKTVLGEVGVPIIALTVKDLQSIDSIL